MGIILYLRAGIGSARNFTWEIWAVADMMETPLLRETGPSTGTGMREFYLDPVVLEGCLPRSG